MDIGRVDIVVAGAGVIGLAIGAALAKAGREVVILESASRIGSETSSRNSEVIHAGIYYPPGSLKARLCVEGKHALYQYCEDRKVSYRKCGKLIVANDHLEAVQLETLMATARANGVEDLQEWSSEKLAVEEPLLRAAHALFSPSTGIIDSHGYMLALVGELEDHGGMVALNSKATSGKSTDYGWELMVDGEQSMTLGCSWLINAAGLGAHKLAAALDGLDSEFVPRMYFAKGSYFTLTTKAPTNRLVYPAPSEAGLGIHLTLDQGGQVRFGPDVEWIDEPNYAVDEGRGDSFYSAIRRYWPGLPDSSLRPDYCGIRPKLAGPGQQAADFRIDGPDKHGLAGLVNLFGIESPGLTASMSVGRIVTDIVLNGGDKVLDL